MREIFTSPDIPHKEDKFVAGLAGRGLTIRRKAGWWEDWSHDSAIVTGPERHYLVVALTKHAQGEDYLRALAAGLDDRITDE
jgi:beta-lactamase class A